MKKIFMILGLFLISFGAVFAASDSVSHDVTVSVSEVVLLAIDDNSVVTLTTVAPGTAGASVTGSDSSADPRSLAYTSLIAAATTRTITAQLDADVTVAGVAIRLSASNASGGVYGTGASNVVLSSGSAATIVTGIGSCATDNGSETVLIYDLNITDESALVYGSSDTVLVTITLTDAA